MKVPSRRTLSKFILFALALLLCWWTLRAIHVSDLWLVWGRLTPTRVALLVLANLAVLIALSSRWWLFLVGQGYLVPFWRLLGYRIAAFAVSYFTPGPHFGGEPLQVYLVSKRHGVPTAVAIAAVTLDKLLEMVINFTVLIAAIGLVLQQQVLTDALGQRALYLALGVLLIPLLLLAALGAGRYPLSTVLYAVGRHPRLARFRKAPPMLARLTRWAQTIQASEEQVIALWRTAPTLFMTAWLISVLSWGALIGEFWYMTYALGLGLSFPQALMLLLAMRIAILLPMPAGLGALEASLALATSALGLSPAAGLSLSLLIRLRDVTLGLVGLWLGGFALWRQAAVPSPAVGELPPEPLAPPETAWQAESTGMV